MHSRILPVFFALFLVNLSLYAQTVFHDGSDYTELEVQFASPTFRTVETSQGMAVLPSVPQTVPVLKKAAPQVLTKAVSIAIPNKAIAHVQIVAEQSTTYQNYLLAPSKGNIKRNIQPETLPYEFGPAYQSNEFYPSQAAEIGHSYVLRSIEGLCLNFYPIQYNPVSKELKVYSSIRVLVSYSYPNGQDFHKPSLTKSFAGAFNRHFVNFSQAKYNNVGQRDKLLIIAPNSYFQTLAPFILWKQQIGYTVKLTDYATLGSANAMDQYIQDQYQNENIGYVLLVGDHQQIPAFNTNYGYSDNYYAMIDGNDWYPELFMGRFSAENVDQLNTMVQRVIRYEKFPQDNGNWYSETVCIGSDQGPGDDNEYDYEHERVIAGKMTSYTFTHAYELYDGSQGGNDAAGNPNFNDLGIILENGVSYVNYTGHGSEDLIVTTNYSITQVNQLNNVDKYPVFVSVGCVNGNFTDMTCFGESWIRATDDNGNPAGAIDAMMSTINQSWNPPMSAQDEMVDIITEQYAGFTPKNFGCIANNGLMKMNDDYGQGGDEMTATWVIFGDPTTMIKTAVPTPLVLTHDGTTPIGTSSITMNGNVEGAVVSVTQAGNVLATGTINGGTVTLSFEPIATTDSLEVVGFSFNTKPYLGGVTVIPNTGPYVGNNNWLLADLNGNGQQVAHYNDSLRLSFDLENIGNAPTANVTATLSTSDPYVTIFDNTANFGDISAGATTGLIDAFGIKIATFVPNNHQAPMLVTCTDGLGNSWHFTVQVTILAPVLSVTDDFLIETNGSINQVLESNETADINIEVSNLGGSNSQEVFGTLTSLSSFVHILNNSVAGNPINVSNQDNYTFQVSVDANAPVNAYANFTFVAASGPYGDTFQFSIPVNQILETFESQDFSKFPWTFSGSSPWITTSYQPYEGNTCSKSGSIGDSQTSVMQLSINVASSDSVAFFFKTSCEQDYDFLKFYINNSLQNQWTGNTAWSRKAYAVSAGQKTFKWVYEKDNYYSDLDDAVYLDNILLPQAVQDSSIGINTLSEAISLLVFPNPAQSKVWIKTQGFQGKSVQVSLINTLGELVYSNYHASTETMEINLDELAKGLYHLNLSNGEQQITHKLSVE
ncbi:MAG: T9SS type A sorting domain-containing protein [Bacteroidia bacterium]|nr:T9SS type A sorting domain-containing protein [Bacteroidia bacterium]